MRIDASTELSSLGLREATRHALAANGARIVFDLQKAEHTRDVVARWSGIGKLRLADLDAAMGRAGLAYGRPHIGEPSCQECPACLHCGNPRADSPQHVTVGLDGRHRHEGHRVAPTCDRCDQHHRTLFSAATASGSRATES